MPFKTLGTALAAAAILFASIQAGAAGGGAQDQDAAGTSFAGASVPPSTMPFAAFEGRWAVEKIPARRQGFWAQENPSLLLDISRCGDAYCAVEVSNDGAACGRTILSDGKPDTSPGNARLEGTLETTPGARPSPVTMFLNPPAELEITFCVQCSFTGYHNFFARAGRAACKPQLP